MSYKTESYNSLISDNSPSCEVWVMQRPDMEKMNVNLHLLVCDLQEEGWIECNKERFNKIDELELLRAKAWAFDGGSPNYVWQSKDQLLACYRDRKVR